MLGLKLNHVRKSGSWSTELSLKFNDGLANRGVNSRLTKPSLKFNGVLVNWRLNCRLIKPALEFNGVLANWGVASILTKPALKFNAGLANLELTSSVSHTPGREYCCEWNRCLLFFHVLASQLTCHIVSFWPPFMGSLCRAMNKTIYVLSVISVFE